MQGVLCKDNIKTYAFKTHGKAYAILMKNKRDQKQLKYIPKSQNAHRYLKGFWEIWRRLHNKRFVN